MVRRNSSTWPERQKLWKNGSYCNIGTKGRWYKRNIRMYSSIKQYRQKIDNRLNIGWQKQCKSDQWWEKFRKRQWSTAGWENEKWNKSHKKKKLEHIRIGTYKLKTKEVQYAYEDKSANILKQNEANITKMNRRNLEIV